MVYYRTFPDTDSLARVFLRRKRHYNFMKESASGQSDKLWIGGIGSVLVTEDFSSPPKGPLRLLNIHPLGAITFSFTDSKTDRKLRLAVDTIVRSYSGLRA
jgi:hypothetical protein